MYLKIIRNDIAKSKLITMTLISFVTAAAMLISLAAILTVNLYGSLEALMTKAKTPHFMQMHSGDIDLKRLNAFATKQNNVSEYQLVKFLNIDGSKFVFGNKTLENSVQDNGISTQNEKFDLLLDLEGNKIEVSDGEVYVPISYMKDINLKLGDTIIIAGKAFTVKGFMRDSIMNASLSSSKRFLVSNNDFIQLEKLGSVEYLIEFRLFDAAALGAFETAYASAGLEMNGPMVTYPLFKMLNSMADGMMIAIIILIALLVVTIAFMCIRFTLVAKIEEDYREIGVMKAIGLPITDIKKLYMAKYFAISAIGSTFGFFLALVFKHSLLANIRLYMGENEHSLLENLIAVIGIILVFIVVMAYVNRVLNQCRKISAAQALRYVTPQEKPTKKNRFLLSRNRLLNINVFIGIKDVLARKKLYSTMLTILIISVFMINVPQNLYHTISAKSFIHYMGIGNYDLRIQISGTAHNINDKLNKLMTKLNADHDISKISLLTTKNYKAMMKDGTEENIKIEIGDHSVFPIEYTKGSAPTNSYDIAISTIYADEMGLNVGDSISVFINNKQTTLIVTGIYSDITNGGKTAKAVFNDPSTNMMWSIISVKLINDLQIEKKVEEYSNAFPFAKTTDINRFVSQTFGSTIASIKVATYVAGAISIVIIILVILMFMKMLVSKDRYHISVLKAFGFTTLDLKVQYISRSIFILMMSLALGTLLANTLGEKVSSIVISSFGASTFKFVVNPLTVYIFSPLMIVIAVILSTLIGTLRIGKIKVSDYIKE